MKLIALCLALLTAAGYADTKIKTLKTVKEGLYEAETTYPEFTGLGVIGGLASKEIAVWVKMSQAAFVKEIKDSYGAEMPEQENMYGADAKVVRADPRILSVSFTITSYTGGAHTNVAFKTFNYAAMGKARRIHLADLYKKGVKYKSRLVGLIIGKLKKMEGAMWAQNGDLRDLSAEMLDRFVIHADGLTFLVAPYEAGPYSSGPFSVKLSFADMGEGFNKAMVTGR